MKAKWPHILCIVVAVAYLTQFDLISATIFGILAYIFRPEESIKSQKKMKGGKK